MELRAIPLDTGRFTTVRVRLVAPDAAGRWALVVDVVDSLEGSFAALGSAPGVQVFDVVYAPRVVEVP